MSKAFQSDRHSWLCPSHVLCAPQFSQVSSENNDAHFREQLWRSTINKLWISKKKKKNKLLKITPWTVWKGNMIGHWKRNSPGQQVPNKLLEISGEITLERMKGWSQSKNNTQLWMWLVIDARSDAVKSNIASEPGMSGPWIKSNKRWQEWTLTFYESKN